MHGAVCAGGGGWYSLVGDRHHEQTCGSATGMFWLPRVTQTAALCGFSHARKLKSLQSRQEKEVTYVFTCGTISHKQIHTLNISAMHTKNVPTVLLKWNIGLSETWRNRRKEKTDQLSPK